MTAREEFYRAFGPKLTEAVVLVMKDEINSIRRKLDLPERNDNQIVSALQTKLNDIPDYAWMSERAL
jgi:hypothetical protein